MRRSQVILLKTQACNKIKSSSRETMMNNPLTRRLPKMTGLRNPSDLQLLILIGKASSVNSRSSIIPKDYFINNDLEYLKGGDLSRRFSTSITKTTATTYELKWIEDLVPELCSPVQLKYDKHAYMALHTGVPNAKASMGVESYQKKLNLNKLDTYKSNLKNKTAYTSYSDPHGIIYVDQNKRKRLMRTDELHKFSDVTLTDVWSALHDIAAGIRMEYLQMRRWSNLDKKRARVMV
nr:hypothetical protein [Tanacetum cinerariifolium]